MEENRKEEQKHEQDTKMNWNIRPYLAVGLIAFLVITLSIIVFFFIYRYHGLAANWSRLMGILSPFFIGFILAYLLNPIVRWEEKYLLKWLSKKQKDEKKRKKTARGISVLGALLVIFLIIAVLLNMVLPQLYSSIERIVISMPRQADSFMKWLEPYISGGGEWSHYVEEVINNGLEYMESWAKSDLLPQTKNILAMVTNGAISMVKLLINFVVGVIISVYMLMGKEYFSAQSKKLVYAVLPAEKGNVVIATVRKANEIFGGFITGKIIDSIIIGLLCFIGVSILKMPYALLVSVIVGVTNVIPFFGPYIGAIPSTILIALADPWKGLYFVIFILILQQVDGNIIGPKILGDSTGLTSFWVVFAILVGGGLFGVVGMIFGVPIFATIYYIFRKVIAYILRRRGLPVDTDAYRDVSDIDPKTGKLSLKKQEK